MRWPFRRKGGDESSGTPSSGRITGSAPVRRPAREWMTLPPLPVTVAAAAPLVTGPAPVVPPLPGKRVVAAPPIAPVPGRVDGLATPLPPRPQPQSVSDAAPAVAPVAPIVHRPTRPMPAETPSLIDAVDEYVGEPREPAEPHRAPGWMRYAPSWMDQAGPATDSIPGLPSMPTPTMIPPPPVLPMTAAIPDPTRRPAEPSPARRLELPPAVHEASSRPADRPRPAGKPRRASLGQSRRLGLGDPISRSAGEPFVPPAPELVHPPEPDPAPREEPMVVDADVEEPPEPPEERDEPPPPPEPSPAPTAPPTVRERDPSTAPPGPVVAPLYRAAPEVRPTRKPRALQRGVVVSRVPPELINAVRASHRADVTDVPVYRGPRVSDEARARGARAFAAGGAVFLPDEAGPADSPATRGLLAHELVHAVQQRTLGTVLPAPTSPEGQALEAEAVAAERWYSGEAGAAAPAPLIHAPMPAARSEMDMAGAAQLAPLAPTTYQSPPSPPSSPMHTPFDDATRREVGEIADHSAKRVVEEWTNPMLGGSRPGGTTPSTQTAAVAPRAAAPAFDRDARRVELENQMLDRMNEERFLRGESPVDTLEQADLDHIERVLDDEAARHGSAPGATSARAGSTAPRSKPSTGGKWLAGLGFIGHDTEDSLNPDNWFEPKAAAAKDKDKAGKGKDDKGATEQLQQQPSTGGRWLAGLGFIGHDTEESLSAKNWFEKAESDKADAAKAKEKAKQEAAAKALQDGEIDIHKIDLDELSTRLYDRLRSRLRLELLIDRERSGRLTDFR